MNSFGNNNMISKYEFTCIIITNIRRISIGVNLGDKFITI